jgi:HK97 gp10 family phage protein
MESTVSVVTNFRFEEASEKIKDASRASLKDCIVDTTEDAKEFSPKKTGNNMRSINFLVGPATEDDLVLEDMQGAVYSSSGYGGYLETGTRKMAARPYMKPAADNDFNEQTFGERMKEHLGES